MPKILIVLDSSGGLRESNEGLKAKQEEQEKEMLPLVRDKQELIQKVQKYHHVLSEKNSECKNYKKKWAEVSWVCMKTMSCPPFRFAGGRRH